MESSVILGEKEWLACCGSVKFAKEMASAGPFSSYQEAVGAASDIWFNKVDVNGWLEAFSAHPQIGDSPSKTHKSPTSAQFSFLVLSFFRSFCFCDELLPFRDESVAGRCSLVQQGSLFVW